MPSAAECSTSGPWPPRPPSCSCGPKKLAAIQICHLPASQRIRAAQSDCGHPSSVSRRTLPMASPEEMRQHHALERRTDEGVHDAKSRPESLMVQFPPTKVKACPLNATISQVHVPSAPICRASRPSCFSKEPGRPLPPWPGLPKLTDRRRYGDFLLATIQELPNSRIPEASLSTDRRRGPDKALKASKVKGHESRHACIAWRDSWWIDCAVYV